MKTPVCEICLKSGILCRSCDEKLRSGKVSPAEIKVAGLLLGLSEKKKSLKEVTLVKVAESPGMAVLVCGKGDAAKFIGAGGVTVKSLEKELGKRVMVVEEAEDLNEFISGLMKPARVASINTLYKNGEEVLRAVTGKGKPPRISQKDFSEIIKLLYGKEAEFGSE